MDLKEKFKDLSREEKVALIEAAREKIIHLECRKIGGHTHRSGGIIVCDDELETAAAIDEALEQLVDAVLALVGPPANDVHERPLVAPEPGRGRRRILLRSRFGENPAQISVIEIWIRVLVELALAGVVGLEFDVQAIVLGGAVLLGIWLNYLDR